MSEPAHIPEPEPVEGELAEVRPLPVAAESVAPGQALEPIRPAPLPTVVAAGTVGFVAGVVAWVLVRALRRPKGSPAVRALGRRRRRGVEVANTRSFLVDVHLLKR